MSVFIPGKKINGLAYVTILFSVFCIWQTSKLFSNYLITSDYQLTKVDLIVFLQNVWNNLTNLC